MNTLLIGLGYKARNGKDVAAKAILDARGMELDVRLYSFAAELKKEYTEACREAGTAYNLIQGMRLTHNLPDWVQYEFGADMTDPLCPYGKQRTLLQWWGTEYRRAQDPFYWVKKLKAILLEEEPKVAIITDMRYPNEALFVSINRGYTVEVQRIGFVDLDADKHKSEHMLDGYPFNVTLAVPDGQVDQLKKEAVEVFDMIIDWVTPKPLGDYNAEAA